MVSSVVLLLMVAMFSNGETAEEKKCNSNSDCPKDSACNDGKCVDNCLKICGEKECVSNRHCSPSSACNGGLCVDPCLNFCGQHTSCTVAEHEPRCECLPGFVGDAKKGCEDVIAPKTLYAGKDGIYISDLREKFDKDKAYLREDGAMVYSIGYHYNNRYIFYTANGRIYRNQYFGSLTSVGTPMIIVDSLVDGPVRLAVDWVHDKLYWMSYKYQTVEMSDLDGGGRTIIADTFKFSFPNNIELDPYQGYLFMVGNNSIYRLEIEGNKWTQIDPEPKTTKHVTWSLALDIEEKRVYYSGYTANTESEELQGYAHYCNYDGLYLDTRLNNKNLYTISMFRNKFHWYDMRTGQSKSMSITDFSKAEATELIKYDVFSIRIYHPDVQKEPRYLQHTNEDGS